MTTDTDSRSGPPEAASLFTHVGDRWLPSELCRGPWSPHALHGGPVAALLVHLAESITASASMQPARLTVELLRPVPLAALRGSARVSRPGRKVQLVEASLYAGDGDAEREVARATLLLMRRIDLPLPADHAGGRAELPPGHAGAPLTKPAWESGAIAYHSHGVEHRVVRGAWGEPGPCIDWIRLRFPVVPGCAPSPLERVAAATDFGNGISSALPYGEWSFINPDLTIYLQRLPRGEFVCLDARTWPEPSGMGLAESELFDEDGRIGRSIQSLLLEKSPPGA